MSRLLQILAITLIFSGVMRAVQAHDVEVDGVPLNERPESHVECEAGFAESYPCLNVELVEFVPLTGFGNVQTNDIWGWTDPVTGVEVVILGLRSGTAFFELDDHGHPTFLGTLPTRSRSSAWRDMKVFENFAFIVSEARNHGMQVFDLTKLRDVTDPPVVFASDRDYLGIRRAHNIAINEDTGYAYIVGSRTCSGGLHMVDIADPLAPRSAGCFSADGYTHDAQCVVYHGPDQTYAGREICFNSNEDTLTIVDVTDKAAPVMISRTPYLSSRYTHQGWLTEDHAFFLLDDELDERDFDIDTSTFVWDVADLGAPLLAGTHQSDSTAIDHNQYVLGNHVFQANYRSGIRILRLGDLSRAELAEVAFFDTIPEDDLPSFSGTWSVYPYFESGFIVASDINKGLFVLKPDLAAVPECDDGIDNDRDGLRDFPEDPTCPDPEDASESLRLDVAIGLMPGFTAHRIDAAPRGLVGVAVFGSETVDVRDIDPTSLALGRAEVSPHRLERPGRSAQRDVDGDGFPDRIARFRIDETGLAPGDREVCLRGLLGGDAFRICHPIAGDP